MQGLNYVICIHFKLSFRLIIFCFYFYFKYEEHSFPYFNDDELTLKNSSATNSQSCKQEKKIENETQNNFYTTKQLKLHAAAIELISDTNQNGCLRSCSDANTFFFFVLSLILRILT